MAEKRTIAIFLFDGFELLDVFGPAEMFGLAADRFRIQLVAEKVGSVASAQGPCVIAESSIFDSPQANLIMVPGGWGTRKQVGNTEFLSALSRWSKEVEYVASVCTGSALLAKAGLLDGRDATSNKRAFEWVEEQGPQVHWVKCARWVVDGKFWTSSGVSAGIDMTIALIGHIAGHEVAERVAGFAEYTWNSDPSVDPFALPDSEC